MNRAKGQGSAKLQGATRRALARLAMLSCLAVVCLRAGARADTTVAVVNPSAVVCPVTKPNPEPAGASTDYLAVDYDFNGADQGISVDDPVNKVTYLFGGDAKAADAVAWFGVFGSNRGGANFIGYLDGADYGTAASLCYHFKLVTVPGMTSASGGGVFSPDVMTAPANDSIDNYIFNKTPNSKGASAPIIPVNSGIPGINEATTGAFLYQTPGANPSETIYLFYAGSPGVQVTNGTLGLPVTSVSYLADWKNPSPRGTTNDVAPTSYQIIARVDYNLENTDTTICPDQFPTICPPAPPAGWLATAPTPPLGGHFIWVTPVMAEDGYVYLFGTGKYRASQVYLARLPAAGMNAITQCPSPPCYLGQAPGFQIWTASTATGSQQAPGWSSSPPSTAEISGAAPLSFPDDSTADVGQISVGFFGTIGNGGLWLMMETPSGNPTFDGKVITRWAPAPTGPWSNALVVFDVTNDTSGIQNQSAYCCQGPWNGKLDDAGLKVWECLGPQDGTPVQQIMECRDVSTTQTSGSAGRPRYGFYSPFMLPYLANVGSSADAQSASGSVTNTFTVSYMLSVFEPYNSVLMNYTLQTNIQVTPSPTASATETPTRTSSAVFSPTPTSTRTLTPTETLQPTPLSTRTLTPTPSRSPLAATPTSNGTPAATATLTPPLCAGDCNSDGQVAIGEILTIVSIALGNTSVTACEVGDANHDGQITVDEILAAVNNALNGCPPPKSIVSISICTTGSGSPGSCPSGSVDSLQAVLAPDGGVINAYGGLFGLSDEHSTILPPGTVPGHANDYLVLGASQTKLAAGGGPGLVVLTGGTGPDARGQWTLDFASDYGLYQPAKPAGSRNGQVFTASMGTGNCPQVASATLQDQTFDLNYAAPGSVIIDPTNPTNSGPGNLLMVYEGTNTCIGVTGPTTAGNFYSTVGIATSLDHGITWPTYRSTWVELPGQNTTTGPNAPTGALGNQVCMGNNCAATPPSNYGRYAVLGQPVTVAGAIESGEPFNHDMGNSELSAFVDDVHDAGGTYLYIVSKYGTGPTDLGGFHFDSSALTGGIAVARAPLNGGTAPLEFMKWYGPSVSYAHGTSSGSFAQRIPPELPLGVTCGAGVCPPFPDNRGLGNAGGGLDSPIFPTDPNGNQNSPSYKACQAPSQGQSMPTISYVEDTHQYLLTFVCLSPTDPKTGSGPAGAAWFYSTLDATRDDLSHQDTWSTPQEIIGSWSPYDSVNQCASGGLRYYSGWYPSFMSMGLKPGHLSTSGYVFLLQGCAGGGSGRQFSSRTFTITTN